MTVFTSHCWKNALTRLDAALRVVACMLALSLPVSLHADARELEFQYTEIVLIENHYVVNAALTGEMPGRVEELVQAGVAVPFIAEFALTRPRWYWFDETVVERAMDMKLSYHALTRQYRLSTEGLHRSFASFEQASSALLSLRNWSVADRSQLNPGLSYNAALRFRLDMSQLPKPFQVAALGSKDLSMATGWSRWTFLAGPR